MISKYIKDLGIYGITFIITKGISVILLPFYLRILSSEDYGIVEMVTILSVPLSILFSLEIYQSIARFFSDLKDEEKPKYISTGFVYYLVAFSILALLIFVFAKNLSSLVLGIDGRENVLRIAGLAIAINALYFYLQAVLRYSLQSMKFSVANLVFTITTIGFSLYFVLYKKLGVPGVYYGQIAGSFTGLMMAIYYNRMWLTSALNFPVLKEMLRFSLPLVPSGLSVYLVTYCDRILIQVFLSLSDLGIFAVSYRIASVSFVIMTVFYNSLVPVIYNYHSKKEFTADILYVYRFTFFAMLSIIALLSVFVKEILIIITLPEYYSAAVLIPFLMFSGFFLQFGNFFLGLAIAKKTKLLGYINVFSAVLNILLNLALVPLFGLIGAAVATLSASVVISVVQVYFSQKYYYLNFTVKPYIKYFAAIVVLCVASFFISIDNLTYSIIIKTALVCIFFIIAIPLSSIIKKQEFFNMIGKSLSTEKTVNNSPGSGQ